MIRVREHIDRLDPQYRANRIALRCLMRKIERPWARFGGYVLTNAAGAADVKNTGWVHIPVAMPNSGDLSRSKPLRSISDYRSTWIASEWPNHADDEPKASLIGSD